MTPRFLQLIDKLTYHRLGHNAFCAKLAQNKIPSQISEVKEYNYDFIRLSVVIRQRLKRGQERSHF
ncbi:MAG: hypothetical protein KME25_21445 [Symplocastrum torsivum CPER-KK1]|uniref:Uncharacterized protein n=1 Tax=Symplocastrum torsivum CPER-KK1 TaxID=450513 RepID=A0A951PNQ7_9CYAN|nr:hypothetical protein [Symplocastrum torsivum CPER-KK1]